MKILKYLFVFFLFTFFSCGQQFKELTPVSNENNIKIKLEILTEKPGTGGRVPFTIRLINTGDRDLARCNIKFDNKYEHQLEGMINKSTDWEGKIKYSMLKTEESVTLAFSDDVDNYSIIGITDKNFSLPGIIELNCLDGKVVWKLNQ